MKITAIALTAAALTLSACNTVDTRHWHEISTAQCTVAGFVQPEWTKHGPYVEGMPVPPKKQDRTRADEVWIACMTLAMEDQRRAYNAQQMARIAAMQQALSQMQAYNAHTQRSNAIALSGMHHGHW